MPQGTEDPTGQLEQVGDDPQLPSPPVSHLFKPKRESRSFQRPLRPGGSIL